MSETQNVTKVDVVEVTKIFGDDPDAALERLKTGATREEILRDTGQVVGVNNVTFQVGAGESFVVMGLSGSGKSTLIRCINRLIDPTSGQVRIDDEDILIADDDRLREIRLTKLGMVFQHFALFPHRTVAENTEYGLKIRGVAADERRKAALNWLDVVGLADWADSYPDALSGGMKQRVGLARALTVEPEVLLMDEPFSALDPLIRRDMQDELIDLQRKFHKSIIFITHDLNEALKLGDRVAIMKQGRFVQIGTPEEIVGSPADPYVEAFTQDVDRGRVVTAGTVMQPFEGIPLGRTNVKSIATIFDGFDGPGVYVTDAKGLPEGLVMQDDVGRALDEGLHDVTYLVRKDFPQVDESMPLADFFGACEAGVPIAVVNERKRLVGVINPLDVFAQLTPGAASGAKVGNGAAEEATGGGTAEVAPPAGATGGDHGARV